jgi:hypothetical protein
MTKGGTGFDIKSKLPSEIENENYDWSLYPDCDFSIVWFSTGCIRNCPFCVVPRKEGIIKSVKPKNLNPNKPRYGFSLKDLKESPYNKRQILRNLVNPKLGLHILNMSFKDKQKTLM